MYYTMKYDSPVGMLTVAANEDAVTALVLDGQKYEAEHLPRAAWLCAAEEAPLPLKKARAWLDDYFAGGRPDPARLPLAPEGSEFRRRVWQALARIPYGETTTYGALAETVGGSARAVGGAVGHNPISIIIPCHRVIGADGSLTGYAGGIEKKTRLLALEGALPAEH